MRILQIVTRSEAGGAQSVVASLAAEFASRGHEVAIASGPEGDGEAWRGLDGRIATFVIPGLLRDISPGDELKALAGIARLYRDWKPDIVHLHTSKAAALGRIAPGIPRRRIVYTMHGFDQLRVANRKFLAVDRALRRACGAVVAVSKVDYQAMVAAGYRPTLIRNGTQDARLLEAADPALVRRLKKIKGDGLPLALMIARDAAPKRVDLARAAASRLEGRVDFAWIGGEPQSGDPPNFHALGSTYGAGAYLRFADIFLLLSDHEGAPMSLLEALSAGLPCVVSAVGGCLETLGLLTGRKAAAGIAVPNEVGAISETIEGLVVRHAELEAMGNAARAAWETKYSRETMASDYLSLYARLTCRERK